MSAGVECPDCRHGNPPQAKFCVECGARFTRSCSGCRTELPEGAKFCPECGQSVTPGRARRAAPAEPASYTPRHLAETGVTSRRSLEGERKPVTVLFCDLANSTPLAEQLGPENMHVLLSRFFDLALEEVHRYEGTVNQFLGDGFMALFGAPIAHEDHPRRAILAALAIRGRLGDLLLPEGIPRGVELSVRMGINTGLVLVGAIGDNLRMDYTAVGDTTNLAARLQQLAEPGTILASDAVVRAVAGEVQAEPMRPLTVKGKREPVAAARVLGFLPRRAAFETQASRGLSRFAGRERELSSLEAFLDRVEGGQGQIVGLLGEPGVGKSRLLYELHRRLGGRSLGWLEGRCLAYASAIPMLPALDILRAHCGILETDPPETMATKVEAALRAVDLDPATSAPYLLHLMGVKRGPELRASPETIRARGFDVFRQVVLRASRHQPLVLVVEDAQWCDRTSEELVESLAARLQTARVLLLVTYRPGYRPPWMERSYASQLTLPALSPEDSRVVIGSVMARLSTELTDTLLGKAEGNPFYLEELARALRDQAEVSNAAVPDTIQGVVLARIDRLPEDAKRLLQTMSVLGRQASRRLLEAVWDGPASLDEHLQTLTRLEFLAELPETDEPAYTFRHALTQEVAYQSLVTPRRRAVHTAAGRLLEDLYPEGTHDGLLAHHFRAAGDLERALRYHRGAAEAARRVYAGREAVEHYAGALEVARLLGDAGDRDVRRGLHLERGRVYAQTGDVPRARADFEAALTEARVAVDSTVEMQALNELGFLLAGAANYEEGLTSLRDAYQLAEQLGNRTEQVAILSRLSIVRTNLLQLAEAVEHAHQARRLARELADERALALALDSLLIASVLLGDLQTADETGAQLVALHRSRGDLWYLQFALHLWSYCAKGAGRWDDATARLDEALSINRQIGDRGNEPLHLAEACWIQRSRGDYGHALATGTRAVTLATELEHPEWVAWSETTLGWTLCDIGATGQAADHLERGLSAARQAGSVFHQLNLAAQLAEVLFRTGAVDRAQALADETEALLSRATLPPGMAVVESFRAYAALAAVRGGMDREAQAERLLTSLLVATRGAAWHEAIATAALGLARCRAAGGDAVVAEDACREALEAAQRGGLPGLAWLAHATFAALHDARGATERAQHHRREAMQIVDRLAASLTDASLREEFRRGARSRVETG